jgi:hypothetical protein
MMLEPTLDPLPLAPLGASAPAASAERAASSAAAASEPASSASAAASERRGAVIDRRAPIADRRTATPAKTAAAPAAAAAAGALATAPATQTSTAPSPPMDRAFIARNQIVERYLAGTLPPKGATDFERFIRSNPELIDELGMAERVHAGLRLLESSGAPEPWAERPKQFWEKLPFVVGIGAAAVAAVIAALVLLSQLSAAKTRVAQLEQQVIEKPMQPTKSKRTVIVLPAKNGPPTSTTVALAPGEMTELKIDLGFTQYGVFQATLDRENQGRVAVLDNVMKDSNGHLRLQLNPSAFGPGDYLLTIEGLNMRRERLAVAWVGINFGR